MASLQDRILQGFKNAGLSLNQARIITAEVGRENSFDPSIVFGVHTDPKNKKNNVGMLSWQNGRETPLLKSLKSNGLLEGGRIKNDQKSLDLMARYAVHEMRTKPEYAQTKKQFLDNPEVPYQDAVAVLGRNFIRWRFDDPQYASGHRNRDQFYAQLGGSKGVYEPEIVPKNMMASKSNYEPELVPKNMMQTQQIPQQQVYEPELVPANMMT